MAVPPPRCNCPSCAPTEDSADDEPVNVVQGVNYNFSMIAPMDWGTVDPEGYLDLWKFRICDAPGLWKANGDVHLYLISRLFELLRDKRKKGWWGLKFDAAGELNCQACWAYVDGQSQDSQMREVGSPCLWPEDWRPCITVPESGQEQLAYHDAGLLWVRQNQGVLTLPA